VAASALPLFALGGVRAEHVPELARAGAAGIAAIREVFEAAQPERAILALLRALSGARSS
jgi:thiamine monophosphate synthase